MTSTSPAILQKPNPNMTDIVRQRYQRIALFYDLMGSMSEKRFGPWRRKLWSQVEGDFLLEVGVGTGKNMPYYPVGVHVTAIDLTPGMLERAQQAAEPLNLGGRLNLQLGDAQDMDFSDRSFDAALATFVFCSVADPVLGLQEVRRVVKRGGQVLLLEHMRSANPLLGVLMDWLNPLMVRVAGANINRRTLDNVRQAGLDIERIEDLGMGGIVKMIVARVS